MIPKKIKSNKGFVILFAVTLAAIFLSIALGVSSIALKEITFGTSAADTDNAIFAADTGLECALVNDKSGSLSFVDPNVPSMTCNGNSVSVSETSTSLWKLIFSKLGNNMQGCSIVTVNKTALPTTTVVSRGYNIGGASVGACNPGASAVERELDTSYSTTSTSSDIAGTGLAANYYNNMTLSSPSVLSRVDSTINFNWVYGSPDASVNVDQFSVRWAGTIKAPETGTYTFTTNTDDGGRLWINGQQVTNDWSDHGQQDASGTISLTAGQIYPIIMEMYENGGGASATLSWAYNSTAKQIIPVDYLYPSALIPVFGNNSFEIPALGSSYQYTPSSAGWSFVSAGVQGNGSAWGAVSAPDGTQTAFIQGVGSISQTITMNAGSYMLSFKVARRATQLQPLNVSIDGTQVGSLVSPPADNSFQQVNIPITISTTGSHTLKFQGTDGVGDKSTFLDTVTMTGN